MILFQKHIFLAEDSVYNKIAAILSIIISYYTVNCKHVSYFSCLSSASYRYIALSKYINMQPSVILASFAAITQKSHSTQVNAIQEELKEIVEDKIVGEKQLQENN